MFRDELALPQHPGDETILRYLDGELSAGDAAKVKEHLEGCWKCRGRADEFNQAVLRFLDYRKAATTRLGDAPCGWGGFRARLDRQADDLAALGVGQSSWRSTLAHILHRQLLFRSAFAAQPRSAWLTAVVALAMTMAVALFYLATPTKKITVAVFFDRIHQARNAGTVPAHYVAVQKVRFRQGTRAIEREVIHGRSRTTSAKQGAQRTPADAVPADPVLTHSLAIARIDLDDPLSPDGFDLWHNSLTGVQDRVTQTTETLTLVAKPVHREPILLASLTVRATDWHPVAERFEFSDEPPLEVREISWELRREALPEITARLPEASSTVTAPAAPPEPSDADLERAEITVREAMQRLGVDRNEAPEIVRKEHRIDILATTDSDERRQQLMTEIEGVPFVHSEIASPGSPVTIPGPTRVISAAPGSASYSTTPPLAKELWDYKGSMNVANNYLDTVREAYIRALADANILGRLAERYPVKDWERLPGDVQIRVNRLASENIQAIQKDAPDYLRRLSDPLDEMLRRTRITSSSATGSRSPACAQWQPLAVRLAAELQETQISFLRLFVVDQADAPLTLSVDTLLPEVAQLRSRVTEELKTFCLP